MDPSPLLPLWDNFSYKEHQVTGITWMMSKEVEEISGGLLCDEMGLGKTMEVLGLLTNTDKATTLLLCPKAVIQQWADAAKRSSINVMTVGPNGWEPPIHAFPGHPYLYITNYEKLTCRPSLGREMEWERVVLDEAHRVKNKKSELYRSIEALDRITTWAVTATPIVNSLADLRALFALVGHDPVKLNGYTYLMNLVNTSLLHRSMAEMRAVLPELPQAPKIVKEELDFLTEDEADFYRGIQGQLLRRWRALEHDNTKAKFQLLMRLRQLSLHPQVYINAQKRRYAAYSRDDFTLPSTKFAALRSMLEDETRPTKWIVFCQFHDEMELLADFLKQSPAVWRTLSYHGGMTANEKEDVIKSSYLRGPDGNKRHDILLLQLQSGGVGLNLQHYSQIVFMSPWWTAALMDQAVGRAVRIGQTEEVKVTMLMLREEQTMNIDATMMNKAEEKRTLLGTVFARASKGDIDWEALDTEEPVEELTEAEAEDPVA